MCYTSVRPTRTKKEVVGWKVILVNNDGSLESVYARTEIDENKVNNAKTVNTQYLYFVPKFKGFSCFLKKKDALEYRETTIEGTQVMKVKVYHELRYGIVRGRGFSTKVAIGNKMKVVK